MGNCCDRTPTPGNPERTIKPISSLNSGVEDWKTIPLGDEVKVSIHPHPLVKFKENF